MNDQLAALAIVIAEQRMAMGRKDAEAQALRDENARLQARVDELDPPAPAAKRTRKR